MTPRGALRTGATLAAGCVAYGALVERRWFRVREHVLPGALRPGAAPLTVVTVADTHLAGPDRRLARLLADVVARHRPDLVVAAGDLCGAVGSEPAVVELLRALPAGGATALAVLGSNDRLAPVPKSPLVYFTDPDRRAGGEELDTDALVAGLDRSGWRVLEDERAVVPLPGDAGGVAVAALHDPHMPDWPLPGAGALRLDDLPGADDAVLRLGLVHAPYVAALDLLRGAGAEVLLAGHTHGGQVRLPGVGALTNNCDLPLDRSRGVSRWDGAWLHVTPGLGQSRYAPYRFACRPEVSVLHLQC